MFSAVDTQILIWAVKKTATPNRVEMIARAEHLVEHITVSKSRIFIPSLVFSEFLVKYTPEERAKIFKEMQRRFYIAPFDAEAAALAAELYAKSEIWKRSHNESNSTKQCIKVDLSILATANHHQVKVFYVEDGPLLNLAQHMKDFLRVSVQPLPPLPLPDAQKELDFS